MPCTPSRIVRETVSLRQLEFVLVMLLNDFSTLQYLQARQLAPSQ
jgi:hypothetical protein